MCKELHVRCVSLDLLRNSLISPSSSPSILQKTPPFLPSPLFTPLYLPLYLSSLPASAVAPPTTTPNHREPHVAYRARCRSCWSRPAEPTRSRTSPPAAQPSARNTTRQEVSGQDGVGFSASNSSDVAAARFRAGGARGRAEIERG